jgi:CRISPR-associated protein Csb1
MDFDRLLMSNGPVALTIREYLEPVHGADGVLFPATFAPPLGEDKPPSYVISGGEKKVALVDTVGSQANRIEPIFAKEEYRELVPEVSVTVNDAGRKVSILEAGHRAADAVFRFSDMAETLEAAFAAIRDHGDSSKLAKIAPTSLVFGAWDSRGTRVKLPRIVGSVIRAYDVEELTRSAQFFGVLEKEETDKLGLDQEFLSNQGLSDSPVGRVHGGVQAKGGVQREATLNLIVVRSLKAGNPEETDKLQRYILGLALVAFYAPAEMFLREGCLLVRSEKEPTKVKQVTREGVREDAQVSEAEVLEFARKAAQEFGVGDGVQATFDPARVKRVKEQANAKKESKAKGKT